MAYHTTCWPHIQGYVSATSVDPGGSLTVYVSTLEPTYTIDVYRIGYYGGTGARLMTSVPGLTGQSQGYYNGGASDGLGSLVSCPTVVIDGTTGLIEARFASSYTLNIPSNWPTGCYLIQFKTSLGYQSYTSFVVRCKGTEEYLVVRGDMTYCAYNNWGGKSLYGFQSSGGVAAVKNSFDKPSVNCNGGDYFVRNDINFIKWAEGQGYDLGYLSDIDVHVRGLTCLSGHKVFISLGHDEYWTKEQRNGVEAFIASGKSAAFAGGNSCFGQVRLETGGLGGANRTEVAYRVAANDPLNGVDNTRVTVQWRQAPVNYPEVWMIGIQYNDLTNGANYAWTVDAGANISSLSRNGASPWAIVRI